MSFASSAEIAAGLFADGDDALRHGIVRRPARAEAPGTAQAIGQPARHRQSQKPRRMAGCEALAQGIDQPLHNLLGTVRADLVAAMADRRIGDAGERGVNIGADRHARRRRQGGGRFAFQH